MVQQRKNAEVKVERHDLLSGLLDATDEEFSGYRKLTDREVLSEFLPFRNVTRHLTRNRQYFYLPHGRWVLPPHGHGDLGHSHVLRLQAMK